MRVGLPTVRREEGWHAGYGRREEGRHARSRERRELYPAGGYR